MKPEDVREEFSKNEASQNRKETHHEPLSDAGFEVINDNENRDISELITLLDSNQEAAILCKTKDQNPNYLSIVAANRKFYDIFAADEDDVIGKNYDFMLDDLDIDSSVDGELDHVHLIKMVKNFTPCLVMVKITGRNDDEDGFKFRVAFNPLKLDDHASEFRYATLTFQKIAESEVKKSANNSAQAATLLRNLERKLRDESMLREVVSLIVSDSTILEVAKKIAKILCNVLKVDRCILHDYADSRVNFAVEYVAGDARYITKSGDNNSAIAEYISFENNFFEKFGNKNEKNFAVAIDDVASDANFLPIHSLCKEFSIASQISVTTTFKNKMNGGIYLHQSQKRSWLRDEIELVSMVADQFSIAIERAVSLDHIMAVNHDLIESSARLKESLAHEQEMRKMQNEFVALVSHEFKTPLQIIDSTREVIVRKMRAAGAVDEAMEKSLDRIKGAIQRMNGLIHSTLNLAKLENGDNALKLEKEVFDLREFIEEIIRKNSILATNKNIKILTKIDDLPQQFYGDKKLLDHSFSNVISNAIKYSNNNSTVKILAKANDAKVALRVIDQGIGIPKGDLENIGQKFFRAKNAISVAGTGIGIYLAKHFVEMHEGEILIDSELNVGTSFTIILPRISK